MRKKIKKILLVLALAILIIPTMVKANNKTAFNFKGGTLYASVEACFNIDSSAFCGKKVLIPNVSVRYDESKNMFYVSVKRSEVNKAFTGKYDNVYSYLEINIDKYDIPNGYYYVKQFDNDNECDYKYYAINTDYDYRTEGFFNVVSTALPLSGANEQVSTGGGIKILSYKPTDVEEGKSYCLDKFNITDTTLDLDKTSITASIEEDVQIDLGSNDKIIDSDIDVDKGKINEIPNNNFYATYFENNKLKYSWTLYDENGNPIEIKNNTLIEIDKSENEKEIHNLFDVDITDRLTILSFEHTGDLKGKAIVKVYVGDKYKEGEKVVLFYYNPTENELELMDENDPDANKEEYYITVEKDGYITFSLEHCSEYVVAPLGTEKKVKLLDSETKNLVSKSIDKQDNNKNNILMYVGIAVIVVAIIVIIVIVVKKIKNKKTRDENSVLNNEIKK